jgi:hypothetical protein
VLLSQPGTWVGRVLWAASTSSSSAQLRNSATSREEPFTTVGSRLTSGGPGAHNGKRPRTAARTTILVMYSGFACSVIQKPSRCIARVPRISANSSSR